MEVIENKTRNAIVDKIKTEPHWDVLVIGGGITGVGIAREVARQGFKVLLLEQKDFAWGTSSRSSKMVHGGLRYLASGHLKLTRHSVKERERLMKEAPGLVNLMPYIWPHYKGRFPGPIVFQILMAIYDRFAGQKYREYINKQITLDDLPGLNEENLIGATRFADAVTDDSRLVMRALQEAQNDGAVSLNYCGVEQVVHKHGKVDHIIARDHVSGNQYSIKARVVISATGAWADKFRHKLGKPANIRPLRGSHLMIESHRLPCSKSITLKHPIDNRSMFIYPWEGMTVIGTTDLDNAEINMTEPCIQIDEVEYLLTAANAVFPRSRLTKDDIVSTFSGVRPIVSNGSMNPSSEKRDHSIWDDEGLITVSGGKLTTFRLIALDVLKVCQKYLPALSFDDKDQVIFNQYSCTHPLLNNLDHEQKKRLSGFYGYRLDEVCECAKEEGWDKVPGTSTYWAQIRFSARSEDIVNLDDLLLRRTRIGLFVRNGGEHLKERIKQICQQELSWTESQWKEKWETYLDTWNSYYYLPV